jgi:Phosphatidylinositol-specific phospholipase C, X domain
MEKGKQTRRLSLLFGMGESSRCEVLDPGSPVRYISVKLTQFCPPPPLCSHTMTTKILFEDIIVAINHFLNFNPHTFPIILSFENHCSIPFQEVMAEQLVRILGKSLYVPPENSLFGLLPSPMA